MKKQSQKSINKSKANNNWKDATRSLSAIIKYATKDGKADVLKMIADANEYCNLKGRNKVTLKDITLPNVKTHMTAKQLTLKDGTDRKLFSFHSVIVLTVGRMAKSKAGIDWAAKASKKAAPKVEKTAGNLPTSMTELRKLAKSKGVNSFGMSKAALIAELS